MDLEVAEYLKNEISYFDSFKSDYVLVEYREVKSGKTWYIVDGYFTLKNKTVLFLDFNYDPASKKWQAIGNYVFVPEENKRFLLKADEVCNPFKRHYIGVIYVAFKARGHLDDLMHFLSQTLNGAPMLYTDGSNHLIQDLTRSLSPKPLFSLKEPELIRQLINLPFVEFAMTIPSGRNASDKEITQVYTPIQQGCQASE